MSEVLNVRGELYKTQNLHVNFLLQQSTRNFTLKESISGGIFLFML